MRIAWLIRVDYNLDGKIKFIRDFFFNCLALVKPFYSQQKVLESERKGKIDNTAF